MSVVYVLTCSTKQKNGSFETIVQDLFSTQEKAKAELKEYKDYINSIENDGIRARTPISQPNDLTIEDNTEGFYQCLKFLSINAKRVK
ncbi:MAG: hypothetical protein GY804_03795 [Alphaproteobacteria bacterium]|nr:hypothetical protein [Alphaproteobacteria bacterium]